MARAENEALVRHIFDAFARKQGFALRSVFADDATWVVPGSGSMAGTFTGPRGDLRLPRTPARRRRTAPTAPSLIDVLAVGRPGCRALPRHGERQGPRLELDQLLLFRIEDGSSRTCSRSRATLAPSIRFGRDPIDFARFDAITFDCYGR